MDAVITTIHSDWLIGMLFRLLSILHITPGINHSINADSDDRYCFSHKEGNQEFIGQSVLHNLYL